MSGIEVHFLHVCSLALSTLVTRCPTQVNVSGEIVTPRRSFYLEESSSGPLSRVGSAEVKHHMERGTIQRGEGNPEVLCITSLVKDETDGVGGQFDHGICAP